MIIVKHVTPLRCKVLQILGFTSIGRMFTVCTIGVKPYKSCENCDNNFVELIDEFYEEFQRGFKEYSDQDKNCNGC